jgi:hypothetical protein
MMLIETMYTSRLYIINTCPAMYGFKELYYVFKMY